MKKIFKTLAVLAAVAALGFGFVSCGDSGDDNNGSGSPSSGGGNGGGGKSGYIGTKAPSEAKAVGDIVFNDGSATPYASVSGSLRYDYEKQKAVVAVIFYAGSSDDVLGAKTLGVGLKENYTYGGRFAKSGTTGYTTNLAEIQCTPSASGKGAAETATFTGDLDGSDNWAKICATDTTAEENAETNYSLFYTINCYGYGFTGDYQSGWYLPTVAELSMLYRVKDTVNAAFDTCGQSRKCFNTYISSSQVASDAEQVWNVDFGGAYGGYISSQKKDDYNYCRAIRAF